MHAVTHLLSLRAVRFILIGGINTAFSYAVYAFFLLLGVDYAVSNLFALIAGVFFSFHTQGAYVFKNRERGLFGRFIIAWAIIYVANVLLIRQLIGLGLDAYSSGALAIAPIAVLSYVFQKFFVFRCAAPA